MTITYQQWTKDVKACGNKFLWSKELQNFDSKFSTYSKSKSDGAKDIAYEHFKIWYQSKNQKCTKERKALTEDYCKKLEETVKIKIAKVGTLTYVPQPQAIINGVYTGFRGLEGKSDYSKPENIAKTGLDIRDQAKTSFSGGGISGWFKNKIFKKYKESADFARYCIAEKDMSRPTIATSLDEGCGGYKGKYIYKFQIPDLREIKMTMKFLSLPEPMTWKLPLKIYIDKGAAKVNNSKIVGINLNVRTHEVVFLTKIDPKYIVEYYDTSEKKWYPMPKVK